tara:strand:- start:78 stop:497 length:420 start_codon:yes stop_codon:yes gene_type:complete
MKNCFKCGEDKPLTEYYKHKQMGDGYLGKCKSCTKKDSTNHRNDNIEKIRKYDRKRGNRQAPEYVKSLRIKYPNQYKSQNMVSNSIRDGKLFKKPCEVCGSENNVHAHHDDYLEPLNVRWLCAAHHKQWHRDNGEGLNR